MREVEANSKVARKNNNVVANVQRFSNAWKNSEEVLPPITCHSFIKAAKSRDWLLSGERKYFNFTR